MKLLSIIKQSLKAIFANKGRSFLTILGVIIGIGSVIGLLALGNGVQSEISNQINSLGSTNITVISGGGLRNSAMLNNDPQSQRNNFRNTQSLTANDLEKLESIQSSDISKASGTLSSSGILGEFGSQDRVNITGVSAEYFEIIDRPLSLGEYFDELDEDSKSRVVILGSTLAEDLFPNESGLGEFIKIQNKDFKIVGILEFQEVSSLSFDSPNSQAFMPAKTALEIFNTNFYNSFTIQARSEDVVDNVKALIDETLLESHGISDPDLADFSVTTPKELLSTINHVTGLLTSLLAGIAAISLLVGGIGIMNIMLVSVTERTREIGLRKAVGAQTSDIMIQFIVEAILLTLIGGILGIGLGYLLSQGASRLLDINGLVTLESILLAVGVSSFIGIIFGIYPAAKAARLNPIDALRYE